MNDRNFLLFFTVHVYFLAELLSSLNSPERCYEQPLNVTHWDPGVGKCSVCWTFIKEVSHWTLTIMLTLGHTCKFKPPPCYKGGGGWMVPHLSSWYVALFENDFAFSGKPLIFSTRWWGIFYGWWHCWGPVHDVINNGCHLGRHLGIYQELVIMLKPREMVIFCAWHKK